MTTSKALMNVDQPPKTKLNQRQEMFCLFIFSGKSQTQAYIDAGFAPAAARICASQLLTMPNIRARLKELNLEIEDEAIATAIERKQTLTEILRGRFGDFTDEEGSLDIKNKEALNSAALHEVKTVHTTVGGKGSPISEKTTTIKLRDPMAAIDLLNKMDRIYAEVPASLIDNRTINFILPDEHARQLAQDINKRLQEGGIDEGKQSR